ncbi:MAG: HupE/UreJ family protein [Candidatus Sulfopaludibacter sp.]|nr:HupE/UreJ family protein [Candidatus Sulfopaludibacter sp.]
MMCRWWLLLAALPAAAHVVSMSTGDIAIAGAQAHYELRMPLYEVSHVQSPEHALLQHIRFFSAGREARLLRSQCAPEAARDSYICTADYEFAAPVEQLGVECTFPSITVPNHVHLLRAHLGAKEDQGIFDLTFTRTTLRFRPPTPAEIAVTQSGAGFVRALSGVAQVLFLIALVLAARGRKELLALAAMFLAGQTAAVLIVPHMAWQPAPRFVEAAAALTVAYLAVEALLLPQAGARWLVAGVMGAFHGLFFYLFVQNTGYRPELVLAGAALAELTALSILALFLLRAGPTIHRVGEGALLLCGLFWFAMRLKG